MLLVLAHFVANKTRGRPAGQGGQAPVLANDEIRGVMRLARARQRHGVRADGSLAFVETSVTTSTGASRTFTYDDNVDANGSLRSDGVIDRKQVITRSTDGAGNVTEQWTNSNGGGVKLSGVQTNSVNRKIVLDCVRSSRYESSFSTHGSLIEERLPKPVRIGVSHLANDNIWSAKCAA